MLISDYKIYDFLKTYFNEKDQETTLLVMLDFMEEMGDSRALLLRTRYQYNLDLIDDVTAINIIIEETTKNVHEWHDLSTPWLTFLQTGNIVYRKNHFTQNEHVISINGKDCAMGFGITPKYFSLEDAVKMIHTLGRGYSFKYYTCYEKTELVLTKELFTNIGKR